MEKINFDVIFKTNLKDIENAIKQLRNTLKNTLKEISKQVIELKVKPTTGKELKESISKTNKVLKDNLKNTENTLKESTKNFEKILNNLDKILLKPKKIIPTKLEKASGLSIASLMPVSFLPSLQPLQSISS
jgi:5'-deoxynucleotidase YfbR-like HD superfamily hydrolase